jgi:hypothetical protein
MDLRIRGIEITFHLHPTECAAAVEIHVDQRRVIEYLHMLLPSC